MLAATTAHATNYLTDYESFPPNSDHVIVGGNGAKGDLLDHLVINVTTSATGIVMITDGASTVADDLVVSPASTPIGTYWINVGARSRTGAWRVTTRGGASVIAVGSFR